MTTSGETFQDLAQRRPSAGLKTTATPLTASSRKASAGPSPAISVARDASLDDCLRAMSEHQVRRVVVVDADGSCCGIVAQADVALNATKGKTGDVVRQVSQPMPAAQGQVEGMADDEPQQQGL